MIYVVLGMYVLRFMGWSVEERRRVAVDMICMTHGYKIIGWSLCHRLYSLALRIPSSKEKGGIRCCYGWYCRHRRRGVAVDGCLIWDCVHMMWI